MIIGAKLKKLVIWTFVAAFVFGGFLGILQPKKAMADARPANCKTVTVFTNNQPGSAGTTQTTSTEYKCVTMSPNGYTLHLWNGDSSGPGSNEEFVFVGTSDYGVAGSGDIGKLVYRSTSNSGHYYAVNDSLGQNTLKLTHHYNVGQNARWDEFAAYSGEYQVIGANPSLPNYKDAFESGNRFVWRVVANGTVKLNNQAVNGDEANIKFKIDQDGGPPLDEVKTDNDGKFEFSYRGSNEDIWINQGTVRNLVFYIALEKNGKKYQTYKTINIPADWKAHSDSNAKLINLGDINLTSANETDEFDSAPGGEQSQAEEMGTDDSCGVPITSGLVVLSIAKVLCALLQGIGSMGEWLINTLHIDEVINAYHQPNHILSYISANNLFTIPTARAAAIDLELEVKKVNEPSTYYTWIHLKDLPNQSKIVVIRDGQNIDVPFTSYTDPSGQKMLLGSDTYPTSGQHTYKVTVYDISNKVLGEQTQTATVPSNSYVPSADDTPSKSSIKRALEGDPAWVLDVWKVVLGISNVFVVVILIFLAIANITRIQYDTYAIKKSLPTLIIGIILANFSILITKMLVDATNVLTATFTGENPGEFIKTIITAVVPADGKPQFMGSTTSLGSLILAIFFAFFAIVALLILGFLFYIRYIVILVLTMVAPFAFIAMAFPPTQGLFKQWWGWYAKFIFMKPISIFLIWIGAEVVNLSGGNGITPWAIAVFLTYAAILVPFKMGGAVMGAWGALGKKGAGLVGAPIKKAAQNEIDYRKKTLGGRFNRFLNESTPIGGFRAKRREELKSVEEQLKGSERLAESNLSPELRAKHMLRRRRALFGTELGDAQDEEMTNRIEAGQNLEGLSAEDYRKITGMSKPMEIAESYMKISNRIRSAKSALEKRRDIDTNVGALEGASMHAAVSEQMKQDLEAAVRAGTVTAGVDGISINRYDSFGNMTVAAGAAGNNLETYADMVNVVAEYRAKAKAASSPAEKARLTAVAEEYDGQLRGYRQNNAARYDYDVILDRNSYGRRFKEANSRVAEESEITVLQSTGHSVVDDTRGAHGTSEYRATAEDEHKAIVGRWSENERTANFAVKQQHMAIGKFIDKGAHGDIEGVHTINEFMNRVQEAHDWDTATNGAAAQIVRRDVVKSALDRMNPKQRLDAQNAAAQQSGHANWAAAQTAGEEDIVMNSVNLESLNLDNTPGGRANLALIQQVAFTLKQRPEIGLSKSPASSMTRAQPNAHPRS